MLSHKFHLVFGRTALAVAIVIGVAALPTARADVGDTLAVITVPVPSSSGTGIGIAVDCGDPANLYYTNSDDPTLYKMTSAGVLISSTPMVDVASGAPISFGAIAWDKSRQLLWAGTDSLVSPVSVYQIDPSTGLATYQFTAITGGFGFTDGLAYDGTDDTIWVSDDVSTIIDHFQSDGTFLGTLTPTDAAGDPLGAISGVLVGKGDLLYLGRNGLGLIDQVKKSDGTFIGSFASPGGRDEDLECDVVSFPGKTVIWSKDAYNDTVTAIEVEDGTCECGGGGELTGRMTGGGSVFQQGTGVRFTHGFELRCGPGQGASNLLNNLQINWQKNSFHLTCLDSAQCIDDPNLDEGSPVAGFNTFIGSGFGRLNGTPGVAIEFKFTDDGEPGKNVDLAEFTIDDGVNPPIVVSGFLNNGNHQAHEE